jgi:hypothetical protein
MSKRLNDATSRKEHIQHLHDNGGSVDEATRYLHLIGSSYHKAAEKPSSSEAILLRSIYEQAVLLVEKMKGKTND